MKIGGKIHLEQAVRTLPRSMYEPEQFPGLIHRMETPKIVILLFVLGKWLVLILKKSQMMQVNKQLTCITRKKRTNDL